MCSVRSVTHVSGRSFLMESHLANSRGGKKGQIRPMIRFLCVSFQRHGRQPDSLASLRFGSLPSRTHARINFGLVSLSNLIPVVISHGRPMKSCPHVFLSLGAQQSVQTQFLFEGFEALRQAFASLATSDGITLGLRPGPFR